MREFIRAFQNTSYYQQLLDSTEVLGIYLGGSVCTGVTDERSDYDIIIITLDGNYIDASKYEYLMYRGKKVHWYYRPLKHFFDSNHRDTKAYAGTMILKNISDNHIVYANPKYSDMLIKLYKAKDKLSLLGIYKLFDVQKDYIDDVIKEGQILEKYYTKYLYHLCLASYYLTEEKLDKDFLRSIKRIRWQPVSDEYKALNGQRLQIYKNYIEAHPINIAECLEGMWNELITNQV